MKTVMKKMFCLMLVAVLLVSAVPAAFADVAATAPCPDGHTGLTGTYVETSLEPTCTTAGKAVYHCNAPAGIPAHDFEVDIPKLGHKWKAATCTTRQTCENCGGSTGTTLPHTPVADARIEATCAATGLTAGEHCSVCNEVLVAQTVIEKLPHNEKADAAVAATCTAPGLTAGKHCHACKEVLVAQTSVAALGHNYVEGVCTRCGDAETETHEVYFSVNGNQNFWHLGVKHNQTVANPGHTYGTDYTYLNENVGDTATQKFMGWSKNPSDTNGSALEYIVQMPVKQSVTYYAIFQAKETTGGSNNTGSGNTGSGNTGSGNTGSGTDTPPSTGNSYVKVHVNLYTSDTYTGTKELVTYAENSTTGVSYSIVTHENLIREELKEQYPDYSWSGHVYEAIKGDDGVEMTDSVGKGVTVYINAYCAEDLVLIAVHNGRTMTTLGDGYIHLYGKKVGETITKSEVIKAVSKQYHFSGLSMYSEQGWEDYVDGESVKPVDSLYISSDPFFIDVRIGGASKVTSSGSSNSADSSNPKTGDAIFAPIMIMGASVSALAVLFYLNKKRAF